MKRTVLAIGMAVWAVVAALLIWFLIANLNGGSGEMFGVRFDANIQTALLKEEEVAAQGIKNIVVEGSWHDVTLKASDTGFHVAQYGGKNTPADQLFNMTRDGETLRITMSRDLNLTIGVNFAREALEVSVPRDWSGSVSAASSSGTVRLEDEFSWENVSLKTSSGSIHIPGIRCGRLDINSSSGSIKCNGDIAATGDISVKSSSGSVHTQGIRCENLDINSSSGSVICDGDIAAAGDITAETTSGSIRFGGSLDGIDISLSSNSGSVKLTLPAELSFTFEAKTTSGSIKTDFETLYRDSRGRDATAAVGGSPTAHIRASTTSGSINVSRR